MPSDKPKSESAALLKDIRNLLVEILAEQRATNEALIAQADDDEQTTLDGTPY